MIATWYEWFLVLPTFLTNENVGAGDIEDEGINEEKKIDDDDDDNGDNGGAFSIVSLIDDHDYGEFI